MTRKNVHLTDTQYERLRALSEKEGLPIAEIIRRAIDNYLSAIKRKESK